MKFLGSICSKVHSYKGHLARSTLYIKPLPKLKKGIVSNDRSYFDDYDDGEDAAADDDDALEDGEGVVSNDLSLAAAGFELAFPAAASSIFSIILVVL